MSFDKEVHGELSEVYYALYLSPRNELIGVLHLQYHDEDDYRYTRFVRNSSDKVHIFGTIDAAKVYLNENFSKDQIDPDDLDHALHNDLIKD